MCALNASSTDAAEWQTSHETPLSATLLSPESFCTGLPPGPLTMGKPGDLEALLERAGYRDIELVVTTATMDFESAEQYRDFLHDQSSSLKKALDEHSAEAGVRTWAAIEREAHRFARPDGSIHFENHVRCASATRAS